MSYEIIIAEHYKNEAATCGDGKESTMRDSYVRDREVQFIIDEISCFMMKQKSNEIQILDIGCGNGFLISVLKEVFPDALFQGIDFTADMIEIARDRELPNVDFTTGSCLDLPQSPHSIDIIITERMMINILDESDQQKAIEQIYKVMAPKGRYIMIESFERPLKNLNLARSQLMLGSIAPAHHNKYISESVENHLDIIGFRKLESDTPDNILSTHFFVTRALHELVMPNGAQVRNTEFVKFFDLALKPGIGDYSPILFRVYEK